MQYAEYVKKLRALADKLEQLGEGEEMPNVSHYIITKEGLTKAIRALGGKWTKKVIGGDNEYAYIHFTSENFPLTFPISRDRVCKKTVTYDCEPIFAPGEDDAIVEETK